MTGDDVVLICSPVSKIRTYTYNISLTFSERLTVFVFVLRLAKDDHVSLLNIKLRKLLCLTVSITSLLIKTCDMLFLSLHY